MRTSISLRRSTPSWMSEPTPRWLVAVVMGLMIAALWWYVEWRTAPPKPPPVKLPYDK